MSTTRSRIPSLLEPYLQLPQELSLVLLTGTLGCSPTWLTSLFVGSALSPKSREISPANGGQEYGVVLVSWMRDVEFWRSHVKRTMSLDIAKLEQQGRFVFVDCLSPPPAGIGKDNILQITQQRLNEAISKVGTANNDNNTRPPILILDNPDLLLATASTTAADLIPFVLRLRSMVHSTIVSCSVDLPLVSAASQSSGTDSLPIDFETAAFISQLGHTSNYIMSVRELQTGSAKDVSGVLRVTRGAGMYDAEDDRVVEGEIRELETLYLVQRDGTVKVFARGQVG